MVFQSVTLEGWTEIMIFIQKTFNILSLFFFIPLVFIGAFFLLNLTLVVIKSEFTKEHEANKEKKRRRNIVLKKVTEEDIKREKEAKMAHLKLKIINKKKIFLNRDRKDSDENVVERIRKNNKKHALQGDIMVQSNFDTDDDQSRTQTAKDKTRGKPRSNIRPSYGINQFKTKKLGNKNSVGDPITEEISNSELSVYGDPGLNPLSANGADELKTGIPKERNVLYLKQGRGKLRMEGMYGISRRRDNDRNDISAQSDLLEDIPLSMGESDNTEDPERDSNVGLPESEIMFPIDSSLTESSKNPKKINKNNKINEKTEGDNIEKAPFSISDSSYDFEDNSLKLSPDKTKNGIEKKNTNYFTATNLSSGDNGEHKTTYKHSIQKGNI